MAWDHNSVGLYDRFELLEMRHNDGVQTYHAREISTARPVQVHFLSDPMENSALLASVERLTDAERRRVLDLGEIQGIPYVVTDRLAGYATFREWLTTQAAASQKPGLDTQFWKLFDPSQGTAPAPVIEYPPIENPPVETPLYDNRFFEKEAQSDPEPQPNVTLRTTIHVVPSAAKLTLGLILGIIAAILFLGMALAIFAFRSH